MAGYGYTNRGYTTYQGTDPRADDWSRQSYGGSGYSDHVCRPVIIDAEGRKRPVISYTPGNSESYVTSERIVEHVHTPVVVTDYKYGPPTTKVETVKDYGVVNSKWGRPSSPEDFITKVQTEASRPARTGLLSTTNWPNTPNSTGYNGTTGYGEYSNYSNSNWTRPSGNVIRDDSFSDYYRRNDGVKERQSPKGWTTTQTSHDTPLSRPTNDIGAAVEYLKEAAQSLSVTGAPATQPRIIDSTEAARRYGNFNLASLGQERYTATMDSREAARKYSGARV
uniref:Uncharacterized protein n=1 Tax=Davidia involucrata TaxID=16924 RepID=A0A5B6YJE1_DAVIN